MESKGVSYYNISIHFQSVQELRDVEWEIAKDLIGSAVHCYYWDNRMEVERSSSMLSYSIKVTSYTMLSYLAQPMRLILIRLPGLDLYLSHSFYYFLFRCNAQNLDYLNSSKHAKYKNILLKAGLLPIQLDLLVPTSYLTELHL